MIGYIAEDFEELGLEDFLVYGAEGKVESIKYDLISVYLVEITKEQQEQIDQLKSENELLQERIEALE